METLESSVDTVLIILADSPGNPLEEVTTLAQDEAVHAQIDLADLQARYDEALAKKAVAEAAQLTSMPGPVTFSMPKFYVNDGPQSYLPSWKSDNFQPVVNDSSYGGGSPNSGFDADTAKAYANAFLESYFYPTKTKTESDTDHLAKKYDVDLKQMADELGCIHGICKITIKLGYDARLVIRHAVEAHRKTYALSLNKKNPLVMTVDLPEYNQEINVDTHFIKQNKTGIMKYLVSQFKYQSQKDQKYHA